MIPIKLKDSTWQPNKGEYFSCIVLNYDTWNDYGYCTLFQMNYCDDNGDVHIIGSIKIYCRASDDANSEFYNKHTKYCLGNEIMQLSEDFCSLGQDLAYYKNIKELFPKEYKAIFKRLNDIAIYDSIRDKFSEELGVKRSLLRFSSAEKSLREAKESIGEEKLFEKDISFKYLVSLPYSESPTELRFDFKQNDELPYRINALVGKNGAGKTQILSRLANSLSGQTGNKELGYFINERPPIDKVMSISYSAFDSFKKPRKDTLEKRSVFSYVYCGIQSENGTLSLSQLKENLQKSFLKVKIREREKILKEVLYELMEDEHRQVVNLLLDNKFEEINLSSGQHILICTITELIANIENESIILFDEPEIHLHPNAIANVIRMFYRLLDEFNSFAIFSTHSPIILQEIPSKYIRVLDRVENELIVRNPEIECFGNNISEIIFDVFDVKNKESNYKIHLENLSKTKDFNEILEIFNGNLSLHALIYLKKCLDKE